MRIIVLIKPGPGLDESDSRAVEAALRIARRRIDVDVSVLTAGPADCLPALRAALALGADEGVHVLDEDLATTDALALSLVLAAAARRHGFDLALCGAESETPNLAAVPVMLAERLGIPALCRAETVDADTAGPAGGDEIIVLCDATDVGDFDFGSGGGWGVGDDGCGGSGEVVEVAVAPPVLVSVTERATAPRYPPFPAVAEARRKLVRTWKPTELGIDPALVHHRAAATAVRSTVLCTRAHTIVAADKDPRAAAARLADFLAARSFL